MISSSTLETNVGLVLPWHLWSKRMTMSHLGPVFAAALLPAHHVIRHLDSRQPAELHATRLLVNGD